MSQTRYSTALAPFGVRSFRFQWPADLAASWAFEMEGLILGWYILVETGSVLWLAVFGSLQFLGTLIAPMFGIAGDRIGYRNLLCLMRAIYAGFAAVLMVLSLAGWVDPYWVFAIAILAGLVRPSDLVMRNLLVGQTMPGELLMRAMGVSRTTADSARIAGALAGAGLVVTLGMGFAYIGVLAFYLLSLGLTFGIAGAPRAVAAPPGEGAMPRPAAPLASPLHDLRDGIAYVWRTPHLRAAMYLAFLVNLTAFPLTGPLLAHVARDIYGMDQTGLGWLSASFSGGALLGSIALSTLGASIRAARVMLICGILWYMATAGFAFAPGPATGSCLLIIAGFTQSLCLVPMAAMLLRTSAVSYRGRVMGVRMLAVYGLPLGLLASGPLVEAIGFAFTAAIYCLIGALSICWLGWRYGADLWDRNAIANAR